MNSGQEKFFLRLFEGQGLPKVFEGLSIRIPGEIDNEGLNFKIAPESFTKSFYRFDFFQEYLDPVFDPAFSYYKVPMVKRYGYAICLDKYSTMESYIKENIKPRLRSTLRNKPAKLEATESIEYRFFYGSIELENYKFLMARLKAMIQERFDQKGREHIRINQWDALTNLFFRRINESRASLFVIYAQNIPIAISLNRHLGTIFSYAIPSYDLSYSKFSPGHILILKQLEWCFDNKYKMFDMGLGDQRYKEDWCNYRYPYFSYFVYKKSDAISAITAPVLTGAQLFNNYMRSKDIDVLYRRFVKALRGPKN